jgi:hypothetical protein
MSDATQFAEMLCGVSPEQRDNASVGQVYMNCAVVIMLRAFVLGSDDPEETAKTVLEAIHGATLRRINEEMSALKTSRETKIGKMFGQMIPDPVETAARMQDALNIVHARMASFLKSE